MAYFLADNERREKETEGANGLLERERSSSFKLEALLERERGVCDDMETCYKDFASKYRINE